MSDTIVNCFGFMGSSGISDMNAQDKDRSFEMVAGTLVRIEKNLYPLHTVFGPFKTWSAKSFFSSVAGAGAAGPIEQIHVCTHGGQSMLSLAYFFDDGDRLKARARKFNKRAKASDDETAALEALDEEDAIMTGALSLFPSAKDNWRRKMADFLRGRLTKTAYVHVWGCYAGAETCNPGYSGDAVLDAYFKRFRLRSPNPGVARDLAMSLQVPVTAAQLLPGKEEGGLSFWIRDGKKWTVKEAGERKAKMPMFLWPDRNARWVTWKPNGTLSDTIRIFSSELTRSELPEGGKGPDWLSALYP